MEDKNLETQTSALPEENKQNALMAEDLERVVKFFHAYLFNPASLPEMPEVLRANALARDAHKALTGLRNALQMTKKGDFSYTVDFKGFVGGALKALQANLNHVAWLARCVADGDLEQRMDFMGDFSDAFNSMVQQLKSTLSELKAKQERLMAEEERWQLAMHCSRDGLWEVELDVSKPPYYSPRLAELTGYSPEDFPDMRGWTRIFHPDDRNIMEIHQNLLSDDPPSSFELDHKLLCSDGRYHWFMTRGMLIRNPVTHRPTRVIGVTADIQERKEREENYSHRATHDALTSLPNRILFDDHLKNSVEFAKRNGSHVAVIMMDLDKFKPINDTYGHAAGDAVLIAVATRLQQNIRESDIAARFGGDEFAMVLAFGKNEWQGVTKVLSRTMVALKKVVLHEGHELRVSASMGISICPEDGDKPKQLMQLADEALYFAKAEGRNACAFWKPEKRYNVVHFDD
ncbi:MAG: diguanylate cyclase [Synergistaceae bacterium]|nr:diguanylate cyclase [Synergistaceae bacterium]